MNCKINEEQLILYLENQLTLMDKRVLKEHIEKCYSCQAKLIELYELKDIWKNPTNSPPLTLIDNIMEGIYQEAFIQSTSLFSKYKTTIHVLVASVATFLLIYTGYFGEIPALLNKFNLAFTNVTHYVQLTTGKGINFIYALNFQLLQFIHSFKLF